MDAPDRESPHGLSPPARPQACAQRLLALLQSLAIYPPGHPRVAAAAEDCMAALHAASRPARPVVLLAQADRVAVDGEAVENTGRLAERLRLAGLRGVALHRDCSPAALLAFAAALNGARRRCGTAPAEPPAAGPGLEPLPLVFHGVHREVPEPEPADDWGLGAAGEALADPRGVRALVRTVADTPQIGDRLRAIAGQLGGEDPASDREIDILATIADLLPIDVTTDSETVATAVVTVLTRLEQALPELLRRNARVKGAELLRVALGIARQYFPSDAAAQRPRNAPPTGRPEDARITADLPLLLEELEHLPDAHGLCLPRADDFDEDRSIVARRLGGIVLHSLAHSTAPGIAAAAVPRLRRTVPRILGELADCYLRPPTADRTPIGTDGGTRVLEALVAAGHLELVKQQRYVDAAFVARGFPDALPVAARVLGTDADSRRLLREALAGLAPMLRLGGAAAAARTGVLHRPEVLATLVATGGAAAQHLLQQAAATTAADERQALLESCRRLLLPAPEAAALQAVRRADELPRDFLPLLLDAACRGDFDGPVRAASAAVLRQAVERLHQRDGHALADLLAAVEALALVPGPETRALLHQLATNGRFTRFGKAQRALRRCARRILEQITAKA
ncbi:MAG: hypothetical protein KF830_07535 [Planctomycetes bacterium]|nr:hypothetical protein [Planctomycetota bacterium]